ncbi:MAG TPA: hypothetical protein VGV87_17510, partial [Blastocatellia bacterium]|nr:hypothetical protein [Blastocatellia bacterium]
FGSGVGGVGVLASGGASNFGGAGVKGVGGTGNGAGNRGGSGIEAFGGQGAGGAAVGLAGKFNGDVQVTGNLSKGGGAFKIDHPLDPENKYLYHSFVESPDMKNIYDGNVLTDSSGEAVVVLPDYFEALNHDFRYQLTVIGTFAQAIIADKIQDNHFRIKTNAPNVEVSWQVTGIRHDAFANKHRIQVEEEKPKVERGYYLHPEAFGQPEEKSINWARDAEGICSSDSAGLKPSSCECNNQINHRSTNRATEEPVTGSDNVAASQALIRAVSRALQRAGNDSLVGLESVPNSCKLFRSRVFFCLN